MIVDDHADFRDLMEDLLANSRTSSSCPKPDRSPRPAPGPRA
jgi:hypothetical protein